MAGFASAVRVAVSNGAGNSTTAIAGGALNSGDCTVGRWLMGIVQVRVGSGSPPTISGGLTFTGGALVTATPVQLLRFEDGLHSTEVWVAEITTQASATVNLSGTLTATATRREGSISVWSGFPATLEVAASATLADTTSDSTWQAGSVSGVADDLLIACTFLNGTDGVVTFNADYTGYEYGGSSVWQYKVLTGAYTGDAEYTGTNSRFVGAALQLVLREPSSGATGTVTATAPVADAAATGNSTVTGAAALAGKLPTAAVAGRSVHTGTAGVQGTLPTVDVTGTSVVSGAVATNSTLPTVDVTGTSVVSGAVATNSTLPTVDATDAVPGSILSCEILPTGWQAKVVIYGFKDGGTYNFGDVDASVLNASFRLTVTSEGYSAAGVLGTRVRYVHGTRICQKAYPNQAVRDETEVAGNVELIIALSDYAYDDDRNGGAGTSGVNPTLTVTNDFYQDNGAGGSSAFNASVTGFAVTNSSTVDYPKVIARWAVVPYQRFTSTFDLEAVAFHRFAEYGKPVACVKFGDGTTDTVVTSMVKSGAADSLPCYKHTISAADYTDNSVVTCQFTAYPWVGDADAALTTIGGTADTLNLGPLPLLADSDDDYGVTHACVNTSTGVDSGTKAFSTLAAAQASPCATIRYALAQIQTYNNTNYSRNNANAGMIYLQSNNHSVNGTGTATVDDVWVTVTRDPDVLKANACVVGGPNASFAAARSRWYDITFVPTGYVLSGGNRTLWLDHVHIEPATQLSNETATGYAVTYNTFCTSNKLNRPWASFSTSNYAALVRGCSSDLCTAPASGASCILTSDFNAGGLSFSTGNGLRDNVITAYTKIWSASGAGGTTFIVDSTGAGNNAAFVSLLIERLATTSPAQTLYAGESVGSINNILIWHNTVAGERSNVAYNSATVARSMSNFSLKFNSFREFNSKHDVFKLDGTRTAGWSILYGVGWEGNNGHSSNFDTYYFGRRSAVGNDPLYVDDNSYTTAGTGDGDYTPGTGSPLIGKIQSDANIVIPWDINGVAYVAGGAAGAITLSSGTTGTVSATGKLPTVDVNGTSIVQGASSAAGKLPTTAVTGGTYHSTTVAAAGKLPTTAITGRTYHSTTVAAAGKLPTTAVTGGTYHSTTVAAAGKLPTVDVNGTSIVNGGVSASAPLSLVDVVGTSHITGTVAIAGKLPLVDALQTVDTLTGDVEIAGTLPTVAAAGRSVHTGSVGIAGKLPLTVGAGQSVHTGTVSASARLPLAHATQELENPTGTVAAQAPRVTVTAAGRTLVTGSVGATAPKAVAELDTFVPLQGSVSVTTGLPTADVVGVTPVRGAVHVSAPLPTVDAVGPAGDIDGDVAASSAIPVVAAQGTSVVVGGVSVVAPLPRVFAAVGSSTSGEVVARSPLVTVTAQGAPVVSGAVNVSSALPSIEVQGEALNGLSGDAVAPSAQAHAVGSPVVSGSVAARGVVGTGSSAGISSVLGTVVARAPRSTTTISSVTGVFGVVAVRGILPRTTARNFATVTYLMINPDQPPFDMEEDPQGRTQFAFNITVHKIPSTTFEAEIAEYLRMQGVAHPILVGSQAAIPTGVGPYISIRQTQGVSALRVHTSSRGRIARPSMQLMVRATSPLLARQAAYEAFNILGSVRNQDLIVPDWA